MISSNTMLPVGSILRGIYRVDKQLASGGFGNTYVVTNLEFDEQYAMKEFFIKGINERDADQTSVSVSNADNRVQYEEQLEKFKKEARRLRQLNNEHIVRVHDLFGENGTYYYVMDFVNGESLSDRLKRTGPLSEKEVRVILIQVLDALEEVHRNNLWHLDLKPANIMVDKDDRALLIDFGASKQLNPEGGATASTSLCYTPGFAPSEQVEQNMGKFGPWTDLYALGATLFNLLTNQRPPQASDINESPEKAFRPLAHVSKQMQDLVCWMMQANRQKRPQSVTALREWLKKAETAPQKTQPSVSTQMAAPQKSEKVPTKTPPKEKNSSLLVPALIILAILVVGGISAYLMLGKKSLAKEVEEYRQFRDLPTELDTLAYSIGMAQTKELKEYLSLSMGVDTAYMNEFSQGVLQGSTLSSQQPEAMTGAPQSAYLAGLQIGSQVGGNAVKNLNSQLFSSDSTKTISLKVLMAGFIQGTMGDHVLMTMDEAREKADRLFNKVKADQLQMTYGDVKEKGEKFLNEIAKQRDVIVDSIMVDTPEGKKWVNLIYRPLKKGNGAYPRNDSKVTVQYEGRLIDGTVFDSSYSRGEPVTFPLTNVIKGWQIGLQNMPVGSKYELYIPQELAYGEKSMESIPPYSALIFTIELISVEP